MVERTGELGGASAGTQVWFRWQPVAALHSSAWSLELGVAAAVCQKPQRAMLPLFEAESPRGFRALALGRMPSCDPAPPVLRPGGELGPAGNRVASI